MVLRGSHKAHGKEAPDVDIMGVHEERKGRENTAPLQDGSVLQEKRGGE